MYTFLKIQGTYARVAIVHIVYVNVFMLDAHGGHNSGRGGTLNLTKVMNRLKKRFKPVGSPSFVGGAGFGREPTATLLTREEGSTPIPSVAVYNPVAQR